MPLSCPWAGGNAIRNVRANDTGRGGGDCRCMTRSSSARGAQARRPRCSSPAKGIASCSSIGRSSRVTSPTAISFTGVDQRGLAGGACSTGSWQPDARPSTPRCWTSSAFLSLAAISSWTASRSGAGHVGGCSTKSLIDAALEAGVEFREQFAVDNVLTEEGRISGIAATRRATGPGSRSARISSLARTVATRGLPGLWLPPPTRPCPHSHAGTSLTGAANSRRPSPFTQETGTSSSRSRPTTTCRPYSLAGRQKSSTG